MVIDQGRVQQISPDGEVPVLPGDWHVDCQGRALLPGRVDCHTHLVNGPLSPRSADALVQLPATRALLQYDLDAKLTAGEVEVLAAHAIARALRDGVTFVNEHLHCPGDVEGGLGAVARAGELLGIRLVASHATRDGATPGVAAAQVESNARFVERYQAHSTVRGGIGFEASYCVADALLETVSKTRDRLHCTAHFHLGENELDLTVTYGRFGRRIVERLEEAGLLGLHAVGAYARVLDRTESQTIASTQTLLALHARAELLWEAGGGGFQAVLGYPNQVGLGSGGQGSLHDEWLAALSGVVRLSRLGRLLDPDGLMVQLCFEGPVELASRVFGNASGVEVGAVADVVLYDAIPDCEGEASVGTLWRVLEAPVAWTVVGGRVAVREGQLLGHDYLELAREAARVLSLRGKP